MLLHLVQIYTIHQAGPKNMVLFWPQVHYSTCGSVIPLASIGFIGATRAAILLVYYRRTCPDSYKERFVYSPKYCNVGHFGFDSNSCYRKAAIDGCELELVDIARPILNHGGKFQVQPHLFSISDELLFRLRCTTALQSHRGITGHLESKSLRKVP